jgi:hypothetical protein
MCSSGGTPIQCAYHTHTRHLLPHQERYPLLGLHWEHFRPDTPGSVLREDDRNDCPQRRPWSATIRPVELMLSERTWGREWAVPSGTPVLADPGMESSSLEVAIARTPASPRLRLIVWTTAGSLWPCISLRKGRLCCVCVSTPFPTRSEQGDSALAVLGQAYGPFNLRLAAALTRNGCEDHLHGQQHVSRKLPL